MGNSSSSIITTNIQCVTIRFGDKTYLYDLNGGEFKRRDCDRSLDLVLSSQERSACVFHVKFRSLWFGIAFHVLCFLARSVPPYSTTSISILGYMELPNVI